MGNFHILTEAEKKLGEIPFNYQTTYPRILEFDLTFKDGTTSHYEIYAKNFVIGIEFLVGAGDNIERYSGVDALLDKYSVEEIHNMKYENFDWMLQGNGIDAEEITVYKDGEKAAVFGSNWQGGDILGADDFMARSVAAYVNNETYANFQYVDERIKSLKDIIFFSVGKAGINDDGRQVPMVIISEWLDRLCLDIYYRLKGEEFIGYSYADMCLLVEGLDGRWIANYEHLYQTIEDDILDPSFEAVIVSPEMQKVIDKVTAEGNQL